MSPQVYATHLTTPRVALLPVTSIKLFSLSESQFEFLQFGENNISLINTAIMKYHTCQSA